MRPTLKTLLLLMTLLPVALPALAAEITVACGDGGAADFCPELSQRWAEDNGHQVTIVTTPASPTEKLSLYQQLLGSQSEDVDVLMVDIVWPGLLAEHLVDLHDYLPEGAAEGFIPSLMENNTVQGKLVALDTELHINGGWSEDLSIPILDRALFHVENSTFIPHLRFFGRACRTNLPSNTAFRGFGGPQGMMLAERVMDRVAAAVLRDPLDVRLANLYGENERSITPYGMRVEDNILPELMTQLAETADYRARRAAIIEANANAGRSPIRRAPPIGQQVRAAPERVEHRPQHPLRPLRRGKGQASQMQRPHPPSMSAAPHPRKPPRERAPFGRAAFRCPPSAVRAGARLRGPCRFAEGRSGRLELGRSWRELLRLSLALGIPPFGRDALRFPLSAVRAGARLLRSMPRSRSRRWVSGAGGRVSLPSVGMRFAVRAGARLARIRVLRPGPALACSSCNRVAFVIGRATMGSCSRRPWRRLRPARFASPRTSRRLAG